MQLTTKFVSVAAIGVLEVSRLWWSVQLFVWWVIEKIMLCPSRKERNERRKRLVTIFCFRRGHLSVDRRHGSDLHVCVAGSRVFPKSGWRETMECFRGLRHLQDKLAHGKSPHETSFRTPFDCPVIHLGAEIILSQSPRKNKVVFVNLVQRCSHVYASDMCWILNEIRLETWSSRTGKTLTSTPLPKFTSRDSTPKKLESTNCKQWK